MSEKLTMTLIERAMFSTMDETVKMSDGRPVPAMTTMLYRVCDNDPAKFAEADRLVGLMIAEAVKLYGQDVKAEIAGRSALSE